MWASEAASPRPPGALPVDLEDYVRALLNVLDDFGAERDRTGQTQAAILNILEDSNRERDRVAENQRALLNILDDFSSEKSRLEDTQRAILNILEDFTAEQERISASQRAMLNILEDFAAEKQFLEESQAAVLNILEDFEAEKEKVEAVNRLLTRKTDELAWSNAELEQFAYVASHDLQEPLRMVSSFVSLLQKRYQGELDERADRYIYHAVDGAKRMKDLIEGLLEYSRAGRHEIGTDPVDLNEALGLATVNLARAIEESGAHVEAGVLPTVRGSTQQLAQVFQNLIGNAIKFRQPGTRPHVGITAVRSGSEWIVSIKDDGIGLDPVYAEKIFSIFQRLHSRSEYPGTGIGLAICKKVIERHGGRIWVESSPGQGSVFRFTLPAPEARRR